MEMSSLCLIYLPAPGRCTLKWPLSLAFDHRSLIARPLGLRYDDYMSPSVRTHEWTLAEYFNFPRLYMYTE